jgi:hypothetical protein
MAPYAHLTLLLPLGDFLVYFFDVRIDHQLFKHLTIVLRA